MPPAWLVSLATAGVALGFFSTVVVLAMLAARPQKMWVMDLVWPVTALYGGPATPWTLWRYGTPPVSPAARHQEERAEREQREKKPFWSMTAVGTTHCGAGCTLGDIIMRTFRDFPDWRFMRRRREFARRARTQPIEIILAGNVMRGTITSFP